MPKIHLHQTTTATPEQYLAGGDSRVMLRDPFSRFPFLGP